MKKTVKIKEPEYESPAINVIVVEVENGFATSRFGTADWKNNDPNNLHWN